MGLNLTSKYDVHCVANHEHSAIECIRLLYSINVVCSFTQWMKLAMLHIQAVHIVKSVILSNDKLPMMALKPRDDLQMRYATMNMFCSTWPYGNVTGG
jgi:hypothetical protein